MKLRLQYLALLFLLLSAVVSCSGAGTGAEPGGGLEGTGSGGNPIDYESLEQYSKRVVDEEVNINELITYSASGYELSDPSVAEIDEDGNIVFLKEGVVTLTITPEEPPAAGAQSVRALPEDPTATELTFVVKPNQFTFKNWVGVLDTLINYSTSAFGLDFIRTTEVNCDFDNYESCANVESDLITSETIQDTVTTLSRSGFYGYKYGENQAAHSLLSSERFEVRSGEAKVVFNNQLFLIGGYTAGDVMNPREFKNDVWFSDDGSEWIEIAESAAFSARSGHKVVVRDGQLWLMGGANGAAIYNDVWVSSDGINWSEVTQTSSFTIRSDFELFVLNGDFYIAGGYTTDGDQLSDLWRSSDGANWTLLDGTFHAQADDTPIVVTGEEGAQTAYLMGDAIYSSTDGTTWNEVLASAPFADEDNREAAVLNGTIWLFSYTFENFGAYGSKNISRIYKSADGMNWSGPIGGIYVGNMVARDSAPLAFKDQIYLVGGRAEILEYTNEVWSTFDGEVWTEHAIGGFYGPRYLHAMTSFNGKLYSMGGVSGDHFDITTPYMNDVWSSDDGLNWTQITPEAPFQARGGHKAVNLGDRMCFVGGYGRRAWGVGKQGELVVAILFNVIGVMGDIWCSFDGETWSEVAPNGDGFDRRHGHAVVFFNDRMWVIGGNLSSTYYADVWNLEPTSGWVWNPEATTYGIHWADYNEVTASAPWGGRTGHAVTVHNGELYLSAGKTSSGEYLDDVWKSSDGSNWTLVTDNISPDPVNDTGMDKRAYHQMLSFDGNLWIIAGRASYHETIFDEDATIYEANDIWMSEDNGATWTEVTADASFEQRQDFQAVIHNGAIYITGGYGGDGYVSVQGKDSILNDVWRSEDGVNWRAGFSKTVTMQR